jgi:hypothetical protein
MKLRYHFWRRPRPFFFYQSFIDDIARGKHVYDPVKNVLYVNLSDEP